MSTQPIDYEALARQVGAIQSKAPNQKIDYDSLAQQAGAISSGNKKPSQQLAPPPKPPAVQSDTGVWPAIKRVGSAILGAPYDIASAAMKPPQTPEEQALATTPIPGAGQILVGAKRLIVDPLQVEAETSRRMTAIAQQTGNQDAQHLANMHAIASGVPVVGPMASNIVQRYLLGDKSGAVTEGAGYIAAPEITSRVMGSELPKNPSPETRANYIARGIGASGNKVDFPEAIKTAMPELDRAAQTVGRPTTPKEMQNVVRTADRNVNTEYALKLQPIRNVQVVPTQIADAIRAEAAKFDPDIAVENATRKQLLARAREMDMAKTYGRLDQIRMNANARTTALENASLQGQTVSLRTQADTIADNIIADGARDLLYNAMDQYHNARLAPGQTPYDFRALKQQQAALFDIANQLRGEATSLANATAVRKGSSLIDRGHVSTYGHPSGRIGLSVHNLLGLFSSPESSAASAITKGFRGPEPGHIGGPSPVPVPAVNLYPTPAAIMLGMKSGDLSQSEGTKMLQRLRGQDASKIRRLRSNGTE